MEYSILKQQIISIMDKKFHLRQALKFLIWLRINNPVDTLIFKPYSMMAKEYGVSVQTVSNYIHTLQDGEYLTVDKLSANRQSIILTLKGRHYREPHKA